MASGVKRRLPPSPCANNNVSISRCVSRFWPRGHDLPTQPGAASPTKPSQTQLPHSGHSAGAEIHCRDVMMLTLLELSLEPLVRRLRLGVPLSGPGQRCCLQLAGHQAPVGLLARFDGRTAIGHALPALPHGWRGRPRARRCGWANRGTRQRLGTSGLAGIRLLPPAKAFDEGIGQSYIRGVGLAALPAGAPDCGREIVCVHVVLKSGGAPAAPVESVPQPAPYIERLLYAN